MKRRVLVILAVIAVLAIYFTGRMDRVLYNVGLNWHECARNGLGATFCGSELDEYREHVQAAKERLTRASEDVERIAREARERASAP